MVKTDKTKTGMVIGFLPDTSRICGEEYFEDELDCFFTFMKLRYPESLLLTLCLQSTSMDSYVRAVVYISRLGLIKLFKKQHDGE